jgi:hypothetical protein
MVLFDTFIVGFLTGMALDRFLVTLPWLIRHYDTVMKWSEELSQQMLHKNGIAKKEELTKGLKDPNKKDGED